MVFVLASRDRYCGFIAPKYDGNEDCSVRVDIGRNKILSVAGLVVVDV